MQRGLCSSEGEEEPAVGKRLRPGALISEGAAHQRSQGVGMLGPSREGEDGQWARASGREEKASRARSGGLLCRGKHVAFILSSKRSLERALSRGMA